jgi:hypothetical protein
MLGANLLESLFVLSFNHQNPQLGLIALTNIVLVGFVGTGCGTIPCPRSLLTRPVNFS